MANSKPQTTATNNPKMPYKMTHEELPPNFELVTVDIGQQFKLNKEIISKFVWAGGTQYWIAKHHSSGIYYTSNNKDPKILNFAEDPDNPRCRGNIKFSDGMGGNPAGKPSGARNRISVKQALEKLNTNPAEFLAGVMCGDIHTLKRYGIKDPRNITVAQKIKVAQVLLDKTVANLKAVDLDSEGEPMIAEEITKQNNRNQIQVYLPSTGSKISISATDEELKEMEEVGVDNYLANHSKETLHYDEDDEDDSMVWRVDND